MGSLTKTTEKKRAKKVVAGGKARKRETRDGTTPRFPVHLETAPDCVLPQPPGTSPTEKR
jgi:hypothetical protein